MFAKRFFCGMLLGMLVFGCGKDKPPTAPAPPSVSSLVGTWTGSGFTVIVYSDYTWHGFGDIRWSCNCGGVPTGCSYNVDVTGTVQPGEWYSIYGRRTDSYGNIGIVSGRWDTGLTALTGSAGVAPRNCAGGSNNFTMKKV